MKIKERKFDVPTSERFEILGITSKVEEAISDIGVKEGLAIITTQHTSAAVCTNEAEEKLLGDMIEKFSELVPPDAGYDHDKDHIEEGEQPNAHAHIISAMIDQPVILTVKNGELDLGKWEEILFIELCGPRERRGKVIFLS